MSHLVILDNEAVQALANPAHFKHRRVVSHVHVVASRNRRADTTQLVVPTAVRVEAGWDRASPAWAFLNRLRINDVALDRVHADVAAAIVARTAVSVADAHLGATVQSASVEQITVVTSDTTDMRLVAGDTNVTVVAI